MLWSTLGNALLIFCLRLTDVSMGTVRVIMVTRGMKKWAALLGFVEVSIWVVAISRVLGNIDTVWNVIGYAGGFACGTLVGMWIEGKLALGHIEVHIVSMTKGQAIADRIRAAGYGATLLQAQGKAGPVYMVNVVAPRKQAKNILRLVNEVDARSFVTIEEARRVVRGYRRLVK
jgi:uncharacterized protein YebE (UPF0316 family)